MNEREIIKLGRYMNFSREQLEDFMRQGHYEPVGIKWLQRVPWGIGLCLFWVWRGLEGVLRRFRHFQGVFGYEWEDAEYRAFSQKTKWVDDE